MDEVDRGNATAEMNLAGYIAEIRARARHNLVPMGVCHNCGEDLRNAVFCDPECRRDFDHRVDVRRRTARS